MKKWVVDFDFNAEILQTILIWIKLPNLPLNWWGMDSLSRIGSGLGVPLYANDCTTSAERIFYARILVEMNVTQPLPTTVKVVDPISRRFEQKIQYDWVPKYCHTCLQVGHTCQPKPPDPVGSPAKEQPRIIDKVNRKYE